MTIQTLVPSEYSIIEQLIGSIERDGIEFDCYGVQYHGQAPELIQFTLKGSDIDLSTTMASYVFDSLQAKLERDWLSRDPEDGKYLNSNRGDDE